MSEEGNKFKSTDIYQTKAGVGAQYFSNQASQSANPVQPKDSSKKHHTKNPLTQKRLRCVIITLSIVIILGVIVAVLAFKVVPSIQEESKRRESEAIKTATQEALRTSHEIISSNSNSGNSEAATIQAFEDRIAATTSDTDKFYLSMQYATYLLWRTNSGTSKAIEIIENSTVPNNEEARLYQSRMLWDAYYKAGNQEKADYYRQIVISNSHTERTE
ncbi:hypothetical protein IJ098_03725 [Candidatus Saccharibacteria bacterium]|nr:hypothetical protein [Candidatus Saccharibacteria bacterium]